MSREILFRAKRKDNGKWVYGDLLHPDNYGNGYCIEDFTKEKNNCYDINPETIGQFTGLTDKNGKEIFEGDIVKWDEKEWGCPYNELVEFDYELLAMRKHDYKQWCEIIGNITDNPELLEKTK